MSEKMANKIASGRTKKLLKLSRNKKAKNQKVTTHLARDTKEQQEVDVVDGGNIAESAIVPPSDDSSFAKESESIVEEKNEVDPKDYFVEEKSDNDNDDN